MKRGKKMLIIIISILVAICLISWGVITYLGRSQALSLKSIENFNGDLYLIHLTKPTNMFNACHKTESSNLESWGLC